MCADTVEKLQIFTGDKIIYVVTISKFLYTEGEPKLTISSDRTTDELSYQLLREVHDGLVSCGKTGLQFYRVFQQYLPFAAPHDTIFSVSFGEKWRQKKTHQGDGGLINRVTGLRVLMIIVAPCSPSRDAVHERKTYFNKNRLGEDASNSIN